MPSPIEAIYWLLVFLVILAIGDIVGTATRARISGFFVIILLLLIGFLTGLLPADIVSRAGLTGVIPYVAALLIFHMGTLIDIRTLIMQWRTVIVAIVSMAAIWTFLSILGPVLLGRAETLVCIPIVNGGIIAAQIMTQAAMSKGYQLAAALGVLVLGIQGFFGSFFMSFFSSREARRIVKLYREGKLRLQSTQNTEQREYPGYHIINLEKYESYLTDFVLLLISAFFAWLALLLGTITPVNYSLWALFLGIVASYLGLAPEKILERARSSGFLMVVLFGAIVPALTFIKAEQLATLTYQLCVVFGISLPATFLFTYILPTWKLVGSRDMAFSIGVAQLLGYPGTYLVSLEVARSVGKTPEEREIILRRVLPMNVIAGFTTVTTLSIVVAGIFVGLL